MSRRTTVIKVYQSHTNIILLSLLLYTHLLILTTTTTTVVYANSNANLVSSNAKNILLANGGNDDNTNGQQHTATSTTTHQHPYDTNHNHNTDNVQDSSSSESHISARDDNSPHRMVASSKDNATKVTTRFQYDRDSDAAIMSSSINRNILINLDTNRTPNLSPPPTTVTTHHPLSQQQQQQQHHLVPKSSIQTINANELLLVDNNANRHNPLTLLPPSNNSPTFSKYISHRPSLPTLNPILGQNTLRSSMHATNVHALNRTINNKICIGTSGRLSVPHNKDHHYHNLRYRYTNCTYVDGNLEITWIQNELLDLSFLQNIREVTGYVLIAYVDVPKITMPNLQIVRGRELFKVSTNDGEFSLFLFNSDVRNLELPNLSEIISGSVGFLNNQNLCHIRSIKWDEIISGPGAKTEYFNNKTESIENCPCHESCEDGRCWSEEPNMCQQMSRKTCQAQCFQGRCYGQNKGECCHAFCAGGCTGPRQSDCLACRNFYDDGVCKQECPPMMRYNPTTYSWEGNPEGKYAYGATCVKNCPDHLLRDSGACVRTCPPDKRNVGAECAPCVGPCPKNCQGVDNVHSGNIESFRGCTVIEGSLTILDTSFKGYTDVEETNNKKMRFGATYRAMHPSELEVFSSLREITGFLNIQASHPEFKNLSYFRNLETIGGRQTTDMFTTLHIVKTSLLSLDLRSLKNIRSGKVAVIENSDMCFADTINWESLTHAGSDASREVKIKTNADPNKCERQGSVCHEECSKDGCWGPRSDDCLSCKNFKLDERCVKNCNSTDFTSSYDAGNNTCKRCHEECAGGCFGPGSNNCLRCKNVKDGPYCVQVCPISKYNSSGDCLPCHESCGGGCTGPSNKFGLNGCNSCHKAIVSPTDPRIIDHCIKSDDPCPYGYFLEYIVEGKSAMGRLICRKCHQKCKTCTAMGAHTSVCECAKYSAGEQCEDECPKDHYTDERLHKCIKCSSNCDGCTGPTDADCIACQQYTIYLNSSQSSGSKFYCTAECPPEKPHRMFGEGTMVGLYCSDKNPSPLEVVEDGGLSIPLGTALSLTLIIISLILYFIYKFQRARSNENTAKLTMQMSGFDDNEPLNPSNIQPNLSKLRIIKESELREGKKLGEGFGGIVYQGQWTPEDEKFVKIPVAIKVLRDGAQPDMNKEFLEEAKLMASVDHGNLVKLLAVCMTSRLMLITKLMPLGCLSEYVKTNKDKIGSKPLLNWCSQIARGMAYLEKHRMVHRDLALRNVLVQTPRRVLITDFGLAKLLDANENEYHSAGGKVPLRWLAPECIRARVFTHKSDVWAFGVTVWELLTYGKIPYKEIEAKEVPAFVCSGGRLSQPDYASLELFCTICNCWLPDPESRPSFEKIAEEFSSYARDPGRYLAIPGDKLLRLPYYSQQDEKLDRIRAINVPIEGAETVMDADEYIHSNQHSLDSPAYPLTPCRKFMHDRGFDPDSKSDFGRPRMSISHEESFSFGVHDNNNNMKKNAMNIGFSNQNKFNVRHHNFNSINSTLPSNRIHYHQKGEDFISDIGDFNQDFSTTPIKTSTSNDLNLPVDDDDYLLPSPGFVDPCDMNLISMDLHGIDNLEYLMRPKYNYINNTLPQQTEVNQYARCSTSDISSSDQISDSNSYTRPDETTV